MADQDQPSADASAEKAYEAASAASSGKTPPAKSEPVESPAAEEAPAPVVSEAPKTAPTKAKPAPKAKAKPRKAPVRTAAKKKPATSAKATPAKAAAAKKKAPATKAAKPKTTAAKKTTTSSKPKETAMTAKTTKTTKPVEGIKKVMSDAQAKAKVAFDKTSAAFGEYGEFTKGNVEAFVESGKILATGLQEMGNELVAEGKTSIETLTSDVKELAAVKSPTDFVKVQSDIMRRNFDTAVSYGSKNSEAMLKLANDAFAPISGRFSLAMAKFRKAA